MSGAEKVVGDTVGSVIVSERFQIVIPKKVRDVLKLEPCDALVFISEGGRMYLEKGEIVREGKNG